MPFLPKTLIQATRPRTYPLAVASILCGTGLAISQLIKLGHSINSLNWVVLVLSLWVALSLQILSNLANDYGDGIKGTDDFRDKSSPARIMASAELNAKQFKCLIYGLALLTFCSGVWLINLALAKLSDVLIFLAFGILAIVAAMAYTMGKRPYGYRAMGEIAVVIFLVGWVCLVVSICKHNNLV